jgi:hypothetical protein
MCVSYVCGPVTMVADGRLEWQSVNQREISDQKLSKSIQRPVMYRAEFKRVQWRCHLADAILSAARKWNRP